MKKLFISILTIILLGFTNCKKSNSDSISILGEWELRTTINGLTGIQTNYSSGNSSILKFDKSNFEIYSNGQLVNSGSYIIIKDTNTLTHSLANRIIYNNETNSIKTFVEIDSEELTIYSDANDGPTAIYLRRNNK